MIDQLFPASLTRQIEANTRESGLPPVEQWDPEFCGNIDMHIAYDGQWYYMGSPITRDRLVRMFSTILKLENNQYYLVTPTEKVGIAVEDAPFVITSVTESDHSDELIFITNTGDKVILDKEHPLSIIKKENGETVPYLSVRGGMKGRLHRNVFYQLVEQAVEKTIEGKEHLGVMSAGHFWSLGELQD